MKKILLTLIIVTILSPNYLTSPCEISAQSGIQYMTELGNNMMNLGLNLLIAQKPNGIRLTNFDYATPYYNEEEKRKILIGGYFCSNYNEYFISGSEVTREEFFTKLGFYGYIQDEQFFKKRVRKWGIASIVSVLSMVTSMIIMANQEDISFSNSFTWLAAASMVSVPVTTTGLIISSFNYPSPPPFEYVASNANSKNREILSR